MGLRRYLSFANVVSVIALFIALGGGAYAVQVAKKNSVKSSSIRNGSVRSVDIGKGQVRASDIEPGLLQDLINRPDPPTGPDPTTGQTKRTGFVCTQTLPTFVKCLGTEVNMGMAGRIFATADGSADSGSGGVLVGVNTCRLLVDGVAFTNEVVIASDFSPSESFSFAGVTEPVTAGTHSINMECKGNGTLPGPRIFFPSLTTLELGPG